MSETHYQCDCDKYNPECRCHPKPGVAENDMREAVARTIRLNRPVGEHASWDRVADAAIAAATPFIEAEQIERLAQRADSCNATITEFYVDPVGNGYEETRELSLWLRAQQEPQP